MQPRARWILAILIVLLALGTFITAIIRSADFTVHSGTPVSVASLQARLAKTTDSSPDVKRMQASGRRSSPLNEQKSARQPVLKTRTAQSVNARPLTNTGPGNIAVIFMLVSLVATATHMMWQRVKLSRKSL